MPAVTLGFEEIEDRLRKLRRRLNSFAAQHAGYVAGSISVFALTLVIVTALRGSPLVFRVTLWLAGAAVLAAAVSGIVILRERWCDTRRAAALADERGRLQDRISTLLASREQRPPSRLASLLLADTLALGARWEPGIIAPRRVPRSLYLLLAALAALGSTAFLSRPVPPAAVAAPGGLEGQIVESQPAAGAEASQVQLEAPQGSQASQPMAGEARTIPGSQDEQGAGGQDGALPAAQGTAHDERSGQRGAGSQLAQQLQQMIRQAFRAEKAGAPQQLAQAEPPPESADRRQDSSDRRGESADGKPGSPRKDGQEDKKRAANDGRATGAGAQPKPGSPGRGEANKPGERGAKDGRVSDSAKGSGAGVGHGGGDLLGGAQGQAAMPGAAEPKTFKVTLTSFLQGLAVKPAPQRRPPSGKVPDQGFAGSSHPPAALSEQQEADDLMRKAEIPPEYEEIVRRVFSRRPE